MPVRILSLNVFPIKSLGGVDLPNAHVMERGLENDRRWMLLGPDGEFATQRDDSRLALFRVSIQHDHLEVRGPSGGSIQVPFAPEGASVRARVWQSDVEAYQVSEAVDAWFSAELQAPYQLVKIADDWRRPGWDHRDPPETVVSFSDACPILVAGTSSLQALNDRLDQPLPMNRFRANVIVEGAQPFKEDDWLEIAVGEVRLRPLKRCGRCRVTTTNQETGEVGQEPLRTLAKFRQFDKMVCFGMYYAPVQTGRIAVGDALTVREGS